MLDPQGHELTRATVFGYNEQYSVLTPEKGSHCRRIIGARLKSRSWSRYVRESATSST